MKKLAIIPARGGSKRIPRKNIKLFNGMPIIAYSIKAALESELFDEVMVSTDDKEIAKIAESYGAFVPFLRSDAASNDLSPVGEVVLEVMKSYEEIGKRFDVFCTIFPTAPFVTGDKLVKAYKELTSDPSADSTFPVTAFSFPIQRSLKINEDTKFLELNWPENFSKRSQDLEVMYHDCGQFYFMKTEAFLKHKRLLSNNTKPLVVSELEVQDIDNETDWKLAEIKYQLMVERNS